MKKLATILFALAFCNSILADAPIEFPRLGPNGEWILNAGASVVAFSPDETILAAAGSLGIFLIDLRSDDLDIVKWFPIENEIIESIQFSPDGRSLLTTIRDIQQRPVQYLQLWDLYAGQRLQTYSVPDSRFVNRSNINPNAIASVSFSPDRSFLLTGNGDSTATLLDRQTGDRLYHLDAHSYQRTDVGYDAGTTAVAFAPDGQTFLTGGWDGVIKMWDTETGSEIRQYIGHIGAIRNLRFTQDGMRFISSPSRRIEDRVIHVWDTTSGETIVSASGHTEAVFDVRWIDNESRFISASQDALIKVWNAQSGVEERSLPSDLESDLSVFSPKGTWLYTDYPLGHQKIWNLSDHNSIDSKTLPFRSLSDAAMTPDDRYFVTEEYNRLSFWKKENGFPVFVREIGVEDSFIWRSSFSHNGRYIATISYPDKTLNIWDIASFEKVCTIARGELSNFSSGFENAEFSADGNKLAAVFSDGYVRVIDWNKREILQSVIVNGIGPMWATLSPDGEKLLTCHATHTRYSVRLWDIETGDLLRLHEPAAINVQSIPTPVNGQWVYAAFIEDDNEATSTVALWDGYTGEERRIALEWPNLYTSDVCFSQDGRFVWAHAPYVGIKLFDAQTGIVVKTFPQTSKINLAKDASWAISYGYGTVRLWDLHGTSFASLWQAFN